MTPDIKPLVAGNWKMNGERDKLDQLALLAAGLDAELAEKLDLAVCPPATLLYVATTLAEDTPLMVGAQNCHAEVEGAHTGEISAEMISDCEADFCIVGHSERRTDCGETDADVAAKVKACWRADLTAIVCIGETEAQYDAGEAESVLRGQISNSIPDGAEEENTVVAYEPVWAIGTGKTPSPDDIREIHAFIREELAERFGGHGERMTILYGGSVKPSNASELLMIENVDGALVGGASLKAADLLAICEAYRKT
ncbi:triose-phosphate isomerase [Ahrensia sp. R2A130]|uniref:triose-phosphate isomerase n=1 Tax=Ahrensia sp. R2A130 TaxID=744979 RepID=UPI0001E0C9A7|nr:triose-phosphate isomerase [Ahrensia sp. R2A130]EFL90256.1 triose-phosphate isomerase [Ahrensia sp. R2A130]